MPEVTQDPDFDKKSLGQEIIDAIKDTKLGDFIDKLSVFGNQGMGNLQGEISDETVIIDRNKDEVQQTTVEAGRVKLTIGAASSNRGTYARRAQSADLTRQSPVQDLLEAVGNGQDEEDEDLEEI